MTPIVAMPSIAKQDLAFGATIPATLSPSQSRLISAERSHSATFLCFNGHSKSFLSSRSLLSGPCNGLGLLSFKPCRKPGLKVQTKAYETGKDDVFPTVIATVVAMASIAKQDLAFGGTISATLFSSQFRLISAGRSHSATFFGFNGHSKSSLSSRSLISPSCSGLGLLSFKPCRKPGQKVQTKAYETGKDDVFASAASDSSVGESESVKKKMQTVKIGIYFATWWSLNVVFNIYNKKVLNAFPYPWLTSTLSLAAGSLIMLVSWMIRIAEFPTIDLDFWKVLAPVAFAHTIGHVAATISMSKVAVSFTHIIKSAEPAFSVLVSRFILGDHFPLPVYLSLIPIIGGCGLTALTELNFNMTGFMGAMISNVAFVFRNIFSKKGMKGKSVSGMNYYACLSILSLLLLAPFAFAVEGPQLWASGWQKAVQDIGPQFVWWVVAQSVFYHLYNQVSYMSLDEISPLTFSIGNTMKRVSVIVSSILIFHTPVRPINAVGAAIAIFGTFLYSQAKQ